MDADPSQDAATQTRGARFAALPEPLRLHILSLTDSKSAARAAAVSRSFRADARALRSTPAAVAQLLTLTYGTPGTVLASMQWALVRPLARNPTPRWYDEAGERGHIRVLALALEAGEPPANAARALCLAAEHRRGDTLRLLLERGVAEGVGLKAVIAAACKGEGDPTAMLRGVTGSVVYQRLPLEIRADLTHAALSDNKVMSTPYRQRVIDWCMGQPNGPTCCLLWAAGQGDQEAVDMALAAGADVSALGGAALQRAARNGKTATVVQLLRAGAAVTGPQLDALVVEAAGLYEPAAAAGMVATLLRFSADSGLGSAHGTAGALSAAARRGNVAVLNQLLAGAAEWSAPVLLEAVLGAGEQEQWAAADCLLPQLLVRMQQEPAGLGPDADLLRAAAAGDAGGAQAEVAAGVSLRAMQLAAALAVRGGFTGAVEALMASPGWAAQLAPALPRLSGLIGTECRAADEAVLQALLALLGGAWPYMQREQRTYAIHDLLERLRHRECTDSGSCNEASRGRRWRRRPSLRCRGVGGGRAGPKRKWTACPVAAAAIGSPRPHCPATAASRSCGHGASGGAQGGRQQRPAEAAAATASAEVAADWLPGCIRSSRGAGTTTRAAGAGAAAAVEAARMAPSAAAMGGVMAGPQQPPLVLSCQRRLRGLLQDPTSAAPASLSPAAARRTAAGGAVAATIWRVGPGSSGAAASGLGDIHSVHASQPLHASPAPQVIRCIQSRREMRVVAGAGGPGPQAVRRGPAVQHGMPRDARSALRLLAVHLRTAAAEAAAAQRRLLLLAEAAEAAEAEVWYELVDLACWSAGEAALQAVLTLLGAVAPGLHRQKVMDWCLARPNGPACSLKERKAARMRAAQG
ncbi:hypothetical protein TSOC_000721 [Tetrabaena socialis]|uniref:Ankyrin repeat domain-containing protein n=1 Tax=Tetrabaena socialis TaxID=47790 RepID=A0A2J8AIK3_9CHLO|nr:hypothetical protein TSOC_000721 [Tetrabaena socialis]|eukprot:PNH12338.1 hypothetical protein TSOC_000721 [Tetrabaena socialis]